MRGRLPWRGALAAVLALGLAGAASAPAPLDARRLEAADRNAEWLSYGKGYAEQRFSPLAQINRDTVARLGVAWSADFDTDRGQEATPVVADGVLYTTTAWSKVAAFDARTGRRLWDYDPKVPGQTGLAACCDVVNRGVAVWGGRVYLGALDGRLIALDARTGREAWSVQTTDTTKPYTITGAPRVIRGRVVIGNGGAEYGVRGYVSAYDAATGKLDWRFYTAPNPTGAPDGAASDPVMARARATWSDGAWKETGGGATAWDAFAYDPELDLLYVGVGNGNPWNHVIRSGGKGDNLFVSSILALHASTGAYAWHYQTTPGDNWDYTATQHIMLADLPIGGRTRHVLMQAPKNGFFYVLDRRTGELLSAKAYAPQSWASAVDLKTGRPVENLAARGLDKAATTTPSPFGGHNWQPMAMSPRTGLVYIPAQRTEFEYARSTAFHHRPGLWNTGTQLDGGPSQPLTPPPATPAAMPGELLAWDPVAQVARWRVAQPTFWNGGVLATAGDLVFQGEQGGAFSAYDAASGRKLWSHDAGNGVIAAPMTYAIDGEQYVALMVGAGGTGQIATQRQLVDRPRMAGRLLVFKLGGTATPAPQKATVTAHVDLARVTAGGDAVRGADLFAGRCGACHGGGAVGGWLPDLRGSPYMADARALRSVLLEGALAAGGMPSFARHLDAAGSEDIRAYVVDEAKKGAAAAPAPARAG